MSLEATVFEFSSYQFEPAKKQAVFHYATKFSGGEPMHWSETIRLPKTPDTANIPKEMLEKLLQSLHIILGISYYKFYCPPKIKIPYVLSKQEAEFWNTVYKKGLGEFFYKNNLDPSKSPKFPIRVTSNQKPVTRKLPVTGYGLRVTNKCLVAIGGGKDSIVAAELLKEQGFDITSFTVETGKPSKIVDDVMEFIGARKLKIQRSLDEKVYQPHQYNGHVPVSAIYAFLGIFSCVLYDYQYIIVSNEYSSNFGNIDYKGLEINHQWSKSFEFETLFQHYVKNSISPNIHYFSLLRPFYEIRIVKMFSRMEKYFPHFSSCNRNFTAQGNESGGLWCGQCAKCVFAFILLSAFLPKEKLIGIFKRNLYQDESLLPLFKDILGLGTMKPFDCVGTFQEAQVAMQVSRKHFGEDFIVRLLCDKLTTSEAVTKEVMAAQSETAIPEQFRFSGMESALILGYGKEGKISEEYVKKYYPKLTIGVGDSSLDKTYLEKQKDFDITIKTPGIQKELVKIPYTTATNIFFSKVKNKNLIIGVTGSKGKSTTASLIYEILKTAGKNVELLGNIGKPMLQILLKPVPVSKIFVLELSSYQLDDIVFSPDIAVVTNLFPEHMDFHGNLKNYYQAKKNIIKYQGAGDYFIYNKKTANWLKGYNGKPVPFSPKTYASNLLGEHNQSNIGAAAAVAEILKIPQEKIKKAVKNFKGLPHRLELVGTFQGITFYDDAISTTPESTIMAIKALRNVNTIFLGGQDRGYDFSPLEKAIKKYKIKNVVLFPDSGEKILKALRPHSTSSGQADSGQNLRILKTENMEEAVKFAFQYTKKGSVCLLSCASPSYSLWKNFEEKGEQFKFFVKKFAKS